jgi:hypothetical protein
MGRDPQRDPPDWWQWDLTFTRHVHVRMEEREFSEVELRGMISDITNLLAARRRGRFIGRTRLKGAPWIVVLEPDFDDHVVVVVTAYRRGS